MMTKTPAPGSPEAVKKGCLCPVSDNRNGKGAGPVGNNGEPLFWVDAVCPMHNETTFDGGES